MFVFEYLAIIHKFSLICLTQEKLRTLLTGSRDETKVITTINRKFPLSIKDIRSVCPVELLGESAWVMPWLTDDVSCGLCGYSLPRMSVCKYNNYICIHFLKHFQQVN